MSNKKRLAVCEAPKLSLRRNTGMPFLDGLLLVSSAFPSLEIPHGALPEERCAEENKEDVEDQPENLGEEKENAIVKVAREGEEKEERDNEDRSENDRNTDAVAPKKREELGKGHLYRSYHRKIFCQ